MKLNIKAAVVVGAVITAGTVLFVGVLNLAFSGYGEAFLRMVDSIYPGYKYGGGFGSVIVGTLYGLVDGGIGGALIAWLYNLALPKH